MYLETSSGFIYISLWRLTFYMKDTTTHRIAFTGIARGVMLGKWFVRFIWEES